MTTDDFSELEALFDEAVALDEPAQAAFLKRLSESAPALAERLKALIDADKVDDSALSEPIATSMEEAWSGDDEDPWVGRTLGAYKIISRLGSGGMGSVFLAERSDATYAQTVAIKVMSNQLLDANAVRRFKAERQILASLSHPNIATLIDGGSTVGELPYLVMEHVDGIDIDDFCTSGDMSLEERLRLFQKVCAAVDYAHRQLIVHRDLKPSNILVDAAGQPKLLDFGIAKLLEPGSYDLTLMQTAVGGKVMTPEYASPEQIRGESISISTDVYALGVLLFRLLTGVSPYGKITSASDYANAILTTDPPRPSTVVGTLASTSPGTSEETPTPDPKPVRLRRLLSGDVDNIVLKCLQKDPERRYGTAKELSADIERFLSNEPVLAAGDHWTYTLRKFVVRRARPLAIAGAVFIGAVSLIGYYTNRLSTERNEAQLAAAQAEEVSDFLVNLFDSASPTVSQGAEVTAVDLLDEGKAQIETLTDQPRLQARLLQIMGESYMHLGIVDTATDLHEQSVALFENDPDTPPLVLAAAVHDQAEALRLRAMLPEAEVAMRRALRIREEELGPNHPEVARTLGRLGTLLFDVKDYPQAYEVLTRALEIKDQQSETPDKTTINILGNLSITLDDMGRYDEAEAIMRRNVELSEELEGEYSPNTIIRFANLGLVLSRRGKFEEALSAALEVQRRSSITWEPTHPNTALYDAQVARSFINMGRFAEAKAMGERAVERSRQGSGERTHRFIGRLRQLGGNLIVIGDFEAAEAALLEAEAQSTEVYGEWDWHTMRSKIHLSELRVAQGRWQEAEAILRGLIDHEEALSRNHKTNIRRILGVAMSHMGRSAEAESLLAEAADAYEATEGPEGVVLTPVLIDWADHARRNGDLPRAEALAERATQIAEAALGTEHWYTARAIAAQARVASDKGERANAAALANRALPVFIATFGADDRRTLALSTLRSQ